VNSNLNSHFRESWLFVGANFHFLAASVAKRAKYLLAPRFSKAASMTLPEPSTVTRTATLILPWIVLRALRGTSGISSWSTVGESFADGRESAVCALEVCALEEGASAAGGAEGDVSGFREVRLLREPAQTASNTTSTTAIAAANQYRFGDSFGGAARLGSSRTTASGSDASD
jgi:hypothetical protein